MEFTLSNIEGLIIKDQAYSDINIFTENHADLLYNPQFTLYHCNSSILDKYLEYTGDKMLSNLPIEEYFESKKNSDLLFSNPEFTDAKISERLFTINDYKRLKPDFINKWYENFEFQNFLYLNSVFTKWKESKRVFKFNIDDEILKCRRAMEEFHSEIQSKESLKHNLFNIKFLLNNLNFIKLENIEDSLQWAKTISTDVKSIIDKNFELVFLLRNEIFVIFKNIEKFLEFQNLPEKNILILLKIIFYISEGFQLLHGFLIIIRTLQKNKILEKKFCEELCIQRIMSKGRELYPYIDKKEVRLFGTEFEFEFGDLNKLKKEEYLFFNSLENSAGCLYDNNIYLYNGYSGLMKFYFSENENFIFLNRNTNFTLEGENKRINENSENSYFSLFSLSNNLFLVQNNLFKKANSNFCVFDKDTLTEKNYKISFDEISNKIFNSEEILPIQVPDYYRKLFKLNSMIADSDVSIRIPSQLSVNLKNNYLYLTYPILRIDENDPDKEFYFSKHYIYVCDIFFLNQDDLENNLHINYSKTVILKSSEDNSSILDKIYESTVENKFSNKFCILNGILISFDESLKYDLISERELIEPNPKFIQSIDKAKSLFLCNQGMIDSILYINFYTFTKEDLSDFKKFSIIDIAGNISKFSEHNHELIFFDYLKELKSFNLNENFDEVKIKTSKSKKNIFQEFFNIEDDEEINQANSLKNENVFNKNYSDYLLLNLAIMSNLKCKYIKSESNSIIEKLKFPFLINLEYPSLRLLHEIILNYDESLEGLKENLLKIYSCLILLKNHLYQIESMNFDLKLIFKNEEEIIKLLATLIKIFENLCLNNKNLDFSNKLEKEVLNISLKIIFQIFSISYLKDEVIQKILYEILYSSFKENQRQDDFIQNLISKEFLIFLSKNNNFSILLKNSDFNLFYIEKILKFYLNIEKNNCNFTNKDLEINLGTNYNITESKIIKLDNFLNKNSNLEKVFNSLYVYCYENNNYSYITSDQLDKKIYSSTLERITQIIFTYSKELLLNISSLLKEYSNINLKREITNYISSKSLIFKLLFSIISHCNIIDIDNQFLLKYWSYIVDIVKLLSLLKETHEQDQKDENQMIHSQKLDIIIDNSQFEDLSHQNKIFYFKLNNGKETQIKIYQNLYVQFYVLASSKLNEVKEFATINSPDGLKVLHVLKTHLFSNLDGPISKTQTSVLENIDMSSGVQVKLNTLNKLEEKDKIFYKIRISNYKFFDNPIDFYLNPCIYLLNKLLKKFCFYENLEMKNSLSISKELIELYNTRLFSSGVNELENCKHDENSKRGSVSRNDIDEFIQNLDNSSNYYSKFSEIFCKNETSFHEKKEIDTLPDLVEDITENNYKNFFDLIKSTNNKFSHIFSVFDKLLRIIQRESIHFNSHVFSGKIPDKLVKAIFFAVIKHESLFYILESQVENLEFVYTRKENEKDLISPFIKPESSNHQHKSEEINYLHLLNDEQFEILFSIFRECSEIRKFYKFKKDEILKDEKKEIEDVSKYFDEVFEKLDFIFNLKVHQSNNYKSSELNLNKSISFEKESSSNLSFKRSISRSEIEKKKGHSFNLNHRTKSLVQTLTHLIKSENISLEKMKGGFEYINLKGKFMEIYLKIIHDLLCCLNNSEIKANLMTNFYNNFKSESFIPNIFKHIYNSSIINKNLSYFFHEILAFILKELNQQNNSLFFTSILLNTLIWKVKGRDFDFIINEKFFSIFKESNKIYKEKTCINNANRLLFIIPESHHSENTISKRFSNFSEVRPIDITHISKLLTDIFLIYSNQIIKKIISDKSNKQETHLGLVRTSSNLNDDYVDLLLNIFEVYEIQFSRLSKINQNFEDSNTFHNININSEINYSFPIQEEDDLNKYEKLYFKQKLYNTLTSFYKLIINQHDKIKLVFKNYSLFSDILMLAYNSKCTEKNLKMIFLILKLFFKYNQNETDLKLFVDVLKQKNLSICLKTEDKHYKDNSNFIKYIFDFLCLTYSIKSNTTENYKIDEISKKNIMLDLILYVYNNITIWSNFISEHITSNLLNFIDEESTINPMDLTGSKLSYLSISNRVLTNSKLNLPHQKINYEPEEKDLNVLIKEGYFVDTHKSIELQLNPKPKKDISESMDDDSEIQEENTEEQYIEVEKFSYVILLKDLNSFQDSLKMNSADYILSENHNLLIIDEFNTPVKDKIISLLISYLEKKIIEEKEYSLKLLTDFIKILKYFNKYISFYNHHEICFIESKNKIFEFVKKYFRIFEKIKYQHEFKFSLISMQNLESWLVSVVNLENNLININEKKRFEILEENCKINSVQDHETTEKNSQIILGKIDFTHKKINLIRNSILGPNMIFPFLDYLILYSSLNSEYIINLETRCYEVDVLCSKGDMKNQKKKNEGKIVLLTDELINELEIFSDEFKDSQCGCQESESESKSKQSDQDGKPVNDLGNCFELSENTNSQSEDVIKEVDSKPENKEIKLKNQLSKIVNNSTQNLHEKKLENFNKFIQKNFNLENCIFILNNKFFNKFKKTMICIGYDPFIVDISNIKNKNDLLNKIRDSNKVEISKEYNTEYFKNLFGDKSKSYSQSYNASNIKKINKNEAINLRDSTTPLSEKDETMSKAQTSQNTPQFNPFEVLLQKYDLKDIVCHSKNNKEKEEEKPNKQISNNVEIIEIKDVLPLKPKKLFKEIFSTFPVKNTYRDTYDLISGVGIFIMQQNFTLLKIRLDEGHIFDKNDILSEIEKLKLLFYQEFYVKTYFNYKNNFDVIVNHLKKLLKFVVKNFTNEDPENINSIISKIIPSSSEIIDYGDNHFNIEKIKTSSQDNFIKLIFELVINFYEDEELDHKFIDYFILVLFKSLIEISENLVKKSLLGNLLNAYDIINFVIKKITQKKYSLKFFGDTDDNSIKESLIFKIMSYLDSSCLFNSILKFLLDKQKKQKSEFYIYSLEVYLLFTSIFQSNYKFSEILKDSIFSNSNILEIHKNIDLIENKLNSKYAKYILALETEEFLKIRSLEINLPNSASYSIVTNSNLSEKLKLQITSKNLKNICSQDNTLCIQPILEYNKISNEYECLKTEFKIASNKFILNLDRSSNLKYVAYSNADQNDRYSTSSSITRLKIINKETNIKKIVQVNGFTFLAWVFEKDGKSDKIKNKFYFNGNIGDITSNDKFLEHPDLNNITNNEKVIEITDRCILTDKNIYIIDEDNHLNLEIINSNLFRMQLPEGKKFIGVAYSSNLVYIWTLEGQVYACGNNSENQISNDNRYRHHDFILMNLPINLICLQVVAMVNSAVLLMKDISLKNNDNTFVYATGLNKNGHCLLAEHIIKSYFQKVSEIPMKYISGNYSCITAISTNNKLYYAGLLDSDEDRNDRTKIYGFKLAQFFVNRSLEVDKVFTNKSFCLATVINRLDDNKIEFFIIGYNKYLPKKYLKDVSGNFNNWENPNKVYLFSNETKEGNSELSDESLSSSEEASDEASEESSEEENDGDQECSHSEEIEDVEENNNENENSQIHTNNEELESISESSSSIDSSKSRKKPKFQDSKDSINITCICSYEDHIYFVGELYTPRFRDFTEITENFDKDSKEQIKNYDKNMKNDKILLMIVNSDKFIHEDEENLISDSDISSNDKFNKKIYNKIKVVEIISNEDTENYYLSIKKYNTSSCIDLISKYESSFKEKNIDLLEEMTKLNDDNEFNFSFIKLKESNNSLEFLNSLEKIKNNLYGFLDVLLISEYIIMNKQFNFSCSDNKFTMSIIREFNQKGNKLYQQNLILAEKQVEESIINIDTFYFEEYIKSKKVYENVISKTITDKNNQSQFKDFDSYLVYKYENYDRYSLMFSPTHRKIISTISSIFLSSTKFLMKNIGIENETLISKMVLKNIKYLDYACREEYYIAGENKIPRYSGNLVTLKIDRALYLKNKGLNSVDKFFEFTNLSQVFNQLKLKNVLGEIKPSYKNYFAQEKNENLFNVDLLGEGAIDGGGPSRQIYTDIFEDLFSNRLDLFIPSPNNISKTGSDRDKWTINPSARSEKHLELFNFIGKMFAFSILSENYVPIYLPSFIWRQILNLDLEYSDLENIDLLSYNSIVKICLFPEKYQDELFELFYILDFTCQLSDGSVVELIPNGSGIKLNKENYKEFVQLYLEKRYGEVREQIKALQKGLFEIIPEKTIGFLSWEDLEEKVCGVKEFDINLLKENTIYEGYKKDSKLIELFWKFLEECSLEEKYSYIKFAWGRTRLPNSSDGFSDKHTIANLDKPNPDQYLPLSHTCYFQVDIPDYSSYEILKEKLTYAMNNSFVISDDQMSTFDI